jgi:glycosyltransferase involved in cell wall biosynthesis
MKICFVVEGAYPYTRGGVSSWVDTMIKQMPESEFVIQTVGAHIKDAGHFEYELPSNVLSVSEVFLNDGQANNKKKKHNHLNRKEREAVSGLLFNRDDHWEALFEIFRSREVSLYNMLMGQDFFDIARQLYDTDFKRVVLTDFIWTCRSMLLPLFSVLKCKPPEADVYHAVSTGYAGIVACYAGYCYNKPVILSEHGIYSREREEEIIRAKWTHSIYKDLWIKHFYTLSRCIYNRAVKVYALFGKAGELQTELGCPTGKIRITPIGIDYFSLSDVPSRAAGDAFINIAAIIRIVPIKDVKTMITAFHYAKEKMPELRLFITGSHSENPEYFDECSELIKSYGTKDIVFTGYVNVHELLGDTDIMLMTSISEGQPISLLEAMAAGKPCITTRVGNCAEMLAADDPDACAGICLPIMGVGKIADAIVRLAGSKELRTRMGRNGRYIVRNKYKIEEMLNTYRTAYRNIYLTGEC